jgi:hypothetical protein
MLSESFVGKLESEAESVSFTSTPRITLLLQLATAQYLLKFDRILLPALFVYIFEKIKNN